MWTWPNQTSHAAYTAMTTYGRDQQHLRVLHQPAEGVLSDDLVMELTRKHTQITATSSVSNIHQKHTCCNAACQELRAQHCTLSTAWRSAFTATNMSNSYFWLATCNGTEIHTVSQTMTVSRNFMLAKLNNSKQLPSTHQSMKPATSILTCIWSLQSLQHNEHKPI